MHVLFSLLLIEWAINYKTIITTLSFILRPVSATRLMKFLITFLVAYACINMIGLSYKFMNPGGDIVVLVDLCNCPPIWCLHTKLYKGAWNVSANNSETVGHQDLRFGQIVYMLVFYNISFFWLLPPDGFKFILLCRVNCVTVKTKKKSWWCSNNF